MIDLWCLWLFIMRGQLRQSVVSIGEAGSKGSDEVGTKYEWGGDSSVSVGDRDSNPPS